MVSPVIELPVEFTKPLKDIEVMENTEIVLTCEVNKPDKPATWQCNGKDLSPSDRILITAEACTHTLTIPKALLEDEAVYKCMVGDRKTSARVSVKGRIFFVLGGYECLSRGLTMACDMYCDEQACCWVKEKTPPKTNKIQTNKNSVFADVVS